VKNSFICKIFTAHVAKSFRKLIFSNIFHVHQARNQLATSGGAKSLLRRTQTFLN